MALRRGLAAGSVSNFSTSIIVLWAQVAARDVPLFRGASMMSDSCANRSITYFSMGENVYPAKHHSDGLSTIVDKFIDGDFPFFTLHANLTSCPISRFLRLRLVS